MWWPPSPGLTPGTDNPFNLKLDKGRGNYDHTHVFNMSWLWTQSHKFSQPLARRLLENWSIGAFHTIQSGAPLTVVMGTDVALNGTGQQGLQHAQLTRASLTPISGGPSRSKCVYHRFFNTAALCRSAVPLGTYGNSGRNIFNGPALNNTDFTLMKDLAIREQLRAQLRGEFFQRVQPGAFRSAQCDRFLGQLRPDSQRAAGTGGAAGIEVPLVTGVV